MPLREFKPAPGWLEESMKDARRNVYLRFKPDMVMRMGQKVSLPIPADDADALYAALNSQFRAWTGMDLKEYPR